MENTKKATVISFIANKGGVSKTRHAIMSANALGAAGYQVIIVDMDFNNSTTSYYISDNDIEGALAEKHGLDWCAGGYGKTWGKGWDNPHFELLENW